MSTGPRPWTLHDLTPLADALDSADYLDNVTPAQKRLFRRSPTEPQEGTT